MAVRKLPLLFVRSACSKASLPSGQQQIILLGPAAWNSTSTRKHPCWTWYWYF